MGGPEFRGHLKPNYHHERHCDTTGSEFIKATHQTDPFFPSLVLLVRSTTQSARMVISKLALGSLFHSKGKEDAPAPSPPRDPAAAAPAPASWAWPSCKLPRTESFEDAAPPPPGTRTLASIFLESDDSSFTNSSSARRGDDCSGSLSTTATEPSAAGGDADADDTAGVYDDDAAAVGGLLRSSDRLLYDPGASGATSSILEEKSASSAAAAEAFVGGLAVALESADPYRDFRASMEEMVAAHGVRGWGWLEEMLGWYLRANGKDTHAAIVAAFVDVVVSIADPARGCCSSQLMSSSSRVTFVDGE
uniref:Uncharacterized protein n=1 Tax=Avena sativa TaxID=4498 RepID=A0ACD5WI05_AVESA